jgi:two-component system chemotaxis response regulator CheY
MKLLIVDDSKAMRLIVRRNLREAGFTNIEVLEKGDGKEAYEWLKTEAVDLVLSDWNMPEMTGIELLRQLRTDGNATKFGFVTSEGSAEMRTEAATAGALFLIAKPFNSDDFRTTLAPYIQG